MFKNTTLLARLLCIFILLPFLRLTQATFLKTKQVYIDRRWTHRPVCDIRAPAPPKNPRAFSTDCRLLIQEQVTGGAGPLGSRLLFRGSTAWKEEVLPNLYISRVPPYSIWSTSLGDCGISFRVHRPMRPSTWPIVQEALKSIAETCVYGKGQGGQLVEGGVEVFISTQRVHQIREAGLGFSVGNLDTTNQRPGLRHPELLPQDPRDELRRRSRQGASMEGLGPQPGSLAASSSSPAGPSRASAAGAGLHTHLEYPPRQSQAEKNRICALVDRVIPQALTPSQLAKVNLCCRVSVGVCSFATGAIIGGVIDQRLLVPIVALGSAAGLGLATLREARMGMATSSTPSSETPSPLSWAPLPPVKRHLTLSPRTPPQPPPQPAGPGRFDVERQEEYRRTCAQLPNARLTDAQRKHRQIFCCKLFGSLCVVGTGAAVSTYTGHLGMGAPWMAMGGAMTYASARSFRKVPKLRSSREDSPSAVEDPPTPVKRHLALFPRNSAPPQPTTSAGHFDVERQEELRRRCAEVRNAQPSNVHKEHMETFCCKLFSALCLAGTGAVVSANTGHVGMGAPWVAAGGVLSYAAVRDFRKAARLPGPREGSPSPADPAALVKRHVPLSPRTPPPLPLSTLTPPPPKPYLPTPAPATRP